MSAEPRKQYYPRYIGLTPSQVMIDSGRVYELLVAGKAKRGAAARLVAVMAEHDANLHPSGGYYSHVPGEFVWTTFADLSGSRSTIEAVRMDLEKLDFVEKVDSSIVGDLVFDRYLFPVLAGNGSRVIVFRLDPLLAVERRLQETFGSPGTAIMFEEGKSYALATLREYFAMLPGRPPEVLLKNVVAGLRATGWGLFSFDVSRLSEGEAKVRVAEPPIAVNTEIKESPFTNGIATGIIEGIMGKRMRVRSSKYDPSKRVLTIDLITD